MSRRKSRSSSIATNVRDLWTLLEEEIKEHDKPKVQAEGKSEDPAFEIDKGSDEIVVPGNITNKVDGNESFILVIGPAKSGKSTFMQYFLNPTRQDKVKSTVALDYTFGRKSNTAGDRKDISHIWELGGGEKLHELIPVVITPQRLFNLRIVMTVDLSKPHDCITTLLNFSKHVNGAIKSSMGSLEEKDLETMRNRMDHIREQFGSTNAIGVPTVILGTKYDSLIDEDGVKRKFLAQTLRYFAFALGASVLFVSKSEKSTLSSMRSLLNHLAFQTEPKKLVQVDANKPVHVLAGTDSLESIGVPPGARREDFDPKKSKDFLAEKRVHAWVDALYEYFGSGTESKTNDENQPEQDDLQLSPEAVIDAMKAQKEIELEQYKNKINRAQRLNCT